METGPTYCDALSKGKSRIVTPSVVTSELELVLLTNMNMERQSVSVDCPERNSARVGISDLLMSVIPAIMQTSTIKGMNVLL